MRFSQIEDRVAPKMIQRGIGGASTNDPAPGTEKDAALAVVSDVAQEIDPLVAKRVLRKIDFYFMPAMLIGKNSAFAPREALCSPKFSGQDMEWFIMTRYAVHC